MSRPSTREPVSDQQREDFIEELAGGLTVIEAALKVGRGRRDFYRLKQTDSDFAAAWREAYEEGTDLLEGEAERRAVSGVNEPVFHKGEQVGSIRRYSDTLLIFLLKARRPEKFRDNVKVEHGGSETPVQVEVKHSVDDLARVAALLTSAGVFRTRPAPDTPGDEVHPV